MILHLPDEHAAALCHFLADGQMGINCDEFDKIAEILAAVKHPAEPRGNHAKTANAKPWAVASCE